jgi:hypothetical protein
MISQYPAMRPRQSQTSIFRRAGNPSQPRRSKSSCRSLKKACGSALCSMARSGRAGAIRISPTASSLRVKFSPSSPARAPINMQVGTSGKKQSPAVRRLAGQAYARRAWCRAAARRADERLTRATLLSLFNETIEVGGRRSPLLLALQASAASLCRALTGEERRLALPAGLPLGPDDSLDEEE